MTRLGNAVLTDEPDDAAARVRAVHAVTAARAETLRAVPVGLLTRSPWQPRGALDAERLAELVESVRARGVLEPLLVREVADPKSGAPRLELLAGERRLEAARLAGLGTVPVRVLAGLSDAEAREVALVENLARADLTVWEEARALEALRDARQAEGKPTGLRALAASSGRSKSVVQRRLYVAERLPPDVVGAVPSWDTLADNAAALEAAAAADTPAERARLLALACRAEAPSIAVRAAREREGLKKVQLAGGEDAEAGRLATYTLRGGAGTKLSLTIRGPVAALPPAQARQLEAELRPILAALRARGGDTHDRAQEGAEL